MYKLRRYQLNRFYLRLIKKIYRSDGCRLLDIGCGDGSFLSYMGSLGWDVFGVEADRDVIKNIPSALRARIRLVNSILDEAGLAEDFFDVITLWNVFEHIRDLEGLLKTIRKILKKNGILALQVPNIESIEAKVFKNNWPHLDRARHIHHFSPASLTATLEKNGFKIKSITYFSPIDKSYRGSIENSIREKSKIKIPSYFFHNMAYKIISDAVFIPFNLISSLLKKGTFITVLFSNEK